MEIFTTQIILSLSVFVHVCVESDTISHLVIDGLMLFVPGTTWILGI